ncbi:MAG TPA: hypothetical protein VFR51_17100 [Pyrinomonadaceae bacterium]|nr:hypothetical protein [Pyrinomonadaceae bacterium]
MFRFIGGSLGTALLGAVLATQLHANVQRLLPGTGALDLISPQSPAGLSPSLRGAYIEAFVASLSTVFLVAAAIALFGLLASLLLPERPLRETIAAAEADIGSDIAQTFAMPTDMDSREQLMRGSSACRSRRATPLHRIDRRTRGSRFESDGSVAAGPDRTRTWRRRWRTGAPRKV